MKDSKLLNDKVGQHLLLEGKYEVKEAKDIDITGLDLSQDGEWPVLYSSYGAAYGSVKDHLEAIVTAIKPTADVKHATLDLTPSTNVDVLDIDMTNDTVVSSSAIDINVGDYTGGDLINLEFTEASTAGSTDLNLFHFDDGGNLTLNDGSQNLKGIYLDLATTTVTSTNSSYGIYTDVNSDFDAAGYFDNGNNTVTISESAIGIKSIVNATSQGLKLDANSTTHTGIDPILDIDLDITTAACVGSDVAVTFSAGLDGTPHVKAYNATIDGLATNVNTASVSAYAATLTGVTNEEADYAGFIVDIASNRGALANPATESGFTAAFSGTLDGITTWYGTRISSNTMTHTDGDWYGIFVNHTTTVTSGNAYGVHATVSATATAAGFFSDGTRTVTLSDGTNAADFSGLVKYSGQGGAASANGLLMGIGTSGDPSTTSDADKSFAEFRTQSTATSGDSRGLYWRHDLNGAGVSGEAIRNFTKITAAAATARGSHTSLDVDGSTGSVTGLGVGVDSQLLLGNAAFTGGTYSALQAEIYSAGSSTDVSGVTDIAFIKVTNSGDGTGQDNVDDNAFLLDLQGLDIGAGNIVQTEADETKFSHKIKCQVGNTTLYLMACDS